MHTQRRQVVFQVNGDERPLQLALVGKLHGEYLLAGGAYHVCIGDNGGVACTAGIGRLDTPDDARSDAPAASMHLHHTGVHLCGQVGKPLGKAVQARIGYRHRTRLLSGALPAPEAGSARGPLGNGDMDVARLAAAQNRRENRLAQPLSSKLGTQRGSISRGLATQRHQQIAHH